MVTVKLRFLGTGGGRYVTSSQSRRTAGILVESGETRFHLDPGPGALVYSHFELDDPLETDGVIVSHGHLDHSNDAEAIVEMVAELAEKPGALFANQSCLEGYGDIEKRISGHHQDLCARVEVLEDGKSFEFRGLEIRSQRMFHSDPKTQGLVLSDEENTVGFWTDSEFSEELTDFYEGCDVMVIYCTMPRGRSIANHTSVSDLPAIVERVEPKTVIVTHFGRGFLNEDMDDQEEWLEDQLEAKVVFAEDGMKFPGDKKLTMFGT